MRLPLLLILPVLILDALVDWYICRAVWRRCRRAAAFWRPFSLWSSIALALFLVVMICWPKKSASDSDLVGIMWALFSYFSIYISKYIGVLFDLVCKFARNRVVRSLPIVFGVGAFLLMWWGALVNRYNIDVVEIDYTNPALPEAFQGLTVAQISDLHVGSYGADTAYVAKVVDAVNALHPDLIVFTGDIVNRRTDELAPFVSTLSRLEAPMGVYSILGNHDYGDYYNWPSDEAKEVNMMLLKDMQAQMGWHMLNNESHTFYAGSESIVLIGVENIGDPPFPIYGDLDVAYSGDLADPAFKILLSHNPAHWSADIAESPDKNIALTLSGHTHAMQVAFGRISPAVFRYKTWGGMYSDSDRAHDLYVNIGIGEVGMPARIGATPEITLFKFSR